MERKTFITWSTLGILGLYLPLEECKKALTPQQVALSTPGMLSEMFSGSRIRILGKEWLRRHPPESSRNFLEKELQDGLSGNAEQLSGELSRKIRQDFREGRTGLLDGWVLSNTESRQCAYYFLSHPV